MEKSENNDKIFYQYREINDYTLDMITNSSLYFSDPYLFNDPFDCRTYFYFGKNKKDQMRLLKYLRIDEEKLILYEKDKSLRDKFLNEVEEDLSKFENKNIGVCCLSDVHDNILMWSHYAKHHKGICIGIKAIEYSDAFYLPFNTDDFNKKNDLFEYFQGRVYLQKVNYSVLKPKPVKWEHSNTDALALFNQLLVKHIDWEYEKEYRMIININDITTNPIQFEPSRLTEVIFGLKTIPEDKNKVINAIKNRPDKGEGITFYECIIKKYEIGVDVIEVKI